MKPIFVSILTLCLFAASGCGNKENGDESGASGGNTAKSQVMSALKQGGYELEQRDSEAKAYYTDKMIKNKYGLDCTLDDLYVGYINQARWMELLVFKAQSDADKYVSELKIENQEGRLIYQDGTSVVVTFSQETIDLFK